VPITIRNSTIPRYKSDGSGDELKERKYPTIFKIPPAQSNNANQPVSSFKKRQYQGVPSLLERALSPYYLCNYEAYSVVKPFYIFVPSLSQS